MVIITVTSSYCLQGHHRITYSSWARSLIVFTEIHIRSVRKLLQRFRSHVRHIWEITMAVSSSQQVPTAFCYFNPHWIFQQPAIKPNEGGLDIQQKAVKWKAIAGNCGLWLFCTCLVQINIQTTVSLKLQWYTFFKDGTCSQNSEKNMFVTFKTCLKYDFIQLWIAIIRCSFSQAVIISYMAHL